MQCLFQSSLQMASLSVVLTKEVQLVLLQLGGALVVVAVLTCYSCFPSTERAGFSWIHHTPLYNYQTNAQGWYFIVKVGREI